jgi:hypothetical protein
MGEAKRRRNEIVELKKRSHRPIVSELTTLTAEQFANMGSMCAWAGWRATYEKTPDGQPPQGWRILYVTQRCDAEMFPGREKTMENVGVKIFSHKSACERDCVLCPKHAKQLQCEVLSPLGQSFDKVEGNA